VVKDVVLPTRYLSAFASARGVPEVKLTFEAAVTDEEFSPGKV